MAGLCSAHLPDEVGEDCLACHALPRDLFANWDEKLAEAEAAGRYFCECGFTFYRTTVRCPACQRPREEKE